MLKLVPPSREMRQEPIRVFSLFTTDTRYSVPTLTLVLAPDGRAAIARASACLAESAFHTAIEVREGNRIIHQECKRDRFDASPVAS